MTQKIGAFWSLYEAVKVKIKKLGLGFLKLDPASLAIPNLVVSIALSSSIIVMYDANSYMT